MEIRSTSPPAIEDIQSYAWRLVDFMDKYRFCFDYHAVDFMLPEYETLPNEWLALFRSCENDKLLIQQLISAVNHATIPPNWPDSMRKYIEDAKSIALLRDIPHDAPIGASAAPAIGRMGQKKLHEVCNYAQIIDSICAKYSDGDRPIIFDLGAGQGYLSGTLAGAYGYDVYAIDCDELQTCGCQRRARDLGIITDSDRATVNMDRGTLTQHTANLTSASQTVQTIQTISNQHRAVCDRYRALCSLHACGDLSPTSIRCFISDPQAKFLFNIGCCYNLMSEPGGGDEQPVPGDDCGFPMSLNVSLAGKARLLLGQAGKTLACQATAKWGTTQTFDEIMEIFKRHFFRALLQRILYDKGFAVTARQSCSSMIVVGKLRPHCYIDFPTYVCHAIARINRKHNMNINAIGIEECERYYAELKPRYFPLICGAWSMRAVLSGVIESLILVDRLLYLLEQPECDYAAIGLLPIFDPKLSPRNMMLFAVKKPI